MKNILRESCELPCPYIDHGEEPYKLPVTETNNSKKNTNIKESKPSPPLKHKAKALEKGWHTCPPLKGRRQN